MSEHPPAIAELNHRFAYHPPRTRQRVSDHEHVRELCRQAANQMDARLPEGREKSLAITKIEEAMFWAQASLARAPDPEPEVSEEEAAAGPRKRPRRQKKAKT